MMHLPDQLHPRLEPMWDLVASAPSGDLPDLLRAPDSVSVVTETGTVEMAREGDAFTGATVTLATRRTAEGLAVTVSGPDAAVKRLTLRWKGALPVVGRTFMGDAWERAYGTLEWQSADPARAMPWYFLVSDGKTASGAGVKVRAGALCAWHADASGVTLTLDVRNGGAGVRLGGRTLEACTVVVHHAEEGETPFASAQALCRQMCTDPRLPQEPVYGFNDWYCDYGANSAQSVRDYTDFLMRLAPKDGARPFMVIDDGWQPGYGSGAMAWNTNNPKFAPSMPSIATDIRSRGARPGIWCRLLLAEAGHPKEWRMPNNPAALDPSIPEVCARVRETVARIRSWGFELIKHDFSTFDLFNDIDVVAPGDQEDWHFADRSRTTAEILRGYYEDVRAGAGDDTLLMGCDTCGHLSAGIFEISRVGDDNSGHEWARTRKMGVNALAFRAPQHGTFFAADADCVGLTERDRIPWRYNGQWLDLLARSGTPLFISFKKGTLTPEQEKEVTAALAYAAKPQPLAEPLDWMETQLPLNWKAMGEMRSYDWGD